MIGYLFNFDGIGNGKESSSGIVLTLLLMGMINFLALVPVAQSNITVDWWPMFRHDLNHTGYSTSGAPNTNTTLWSYTTGGFLWSSPAVADGKVYIGSYDGNVYAFYTPVLVPPIPEFSLGTTIISSLSTALYLLIRRRRLSK